MKTLEKALVTYVEIPKYTSSFLHTLVHFERTYGN